jgi:mannose-6-phosphate isomerase-like protein (cupin superfamily)
MAYIVNWRDQQPEVAHLSAIRWPGLKHHTAAAAHSPKECLRMQNLQGIVRHLLQGRKTSDHHKHDNIEQAYYIISGSGQVLVGEKRYPVVPGDAVYLPPGLHHQMFNDTNDDWLEHLVLGMKTSDGIKGECVICNVSDVTPQSDGAGGNRWRQLTRQDDGPNGCFHAIHYIDRESLQAGHQTRVQNEDDFELVYYMLEGEGVLILDDEEQALRPGDLVHLPVQTTHRIRNSGKTFLKYVIVAS